MVASIRVDANIFFNWLNGPIKKHVLIQKVNMQNRKKYKSVNFFFVFLFWVKNLNKDEFSGKKKYTAMN